MRQVSLSGTKQEKRGSFLPLCLFIAAAAHVLFFVIIDLRLPSDRSSSAVNKDIAVSFFQQVKPESGAQPVPVIKPVQGTESSPVKRTEPVRPVTDPQPVIKEAVTEAPPAPAPVVEEAVMPFPSAVKAEIPAFENIDALKIKYRDKVRDIISANKLYPVTARRRAIQGSVTVAFSVYENGDIVNPAVIVSSGFDILDRTALRILVDSSPLPVPPERMDFSLPISFILN